MSDQTPSVSKIRRLALPSAVVRSSKLGWERESGAVPSISSVERPVSDSASARLPPTIPPPTITTSYVARSPAAAFGLTD